MNSRDKAYGVIRSIARRRKEERLSVIEELRRDEIFDALYRSINSIKWDIAMSSETSEKDALQNRLSTMETKMAEFIREKGYTEDIFSDTYSCELCHDTGVCEGKICVCVEQERKRIEIERSPLLKGVPDGYDKIDFSFYGEHADMYKKYASYVRTKFAEGELNYTVLSGKTGTAKTYLACVCARNMMEKGQSVSVINSLRLNKIFLEYHCAFLENKDEIWEEVLQPDVLVVDDLGVEQLLNNVTLNYLYALLIERIEKKTIFTTNLDVRELEIRYGQRIVSRLLDKRKGAVLPISGRDYRL